MNPAQGLEDLRVVVLSEDVEGRSKRPRKNGGVLRDNGQLRPQVGEADVCDVETVQQDLARMSFDETEESEREGGLNDRGKNTSQHADVRWRNPKAD